MEQAQAVISLSQKPLMVKPVSAASIMYSAISFANITENTPRIATRQLADAIPEIVRIAPNNWTTISIIQSTITDKTMCQKPSILTCSGKILVIAQSINPVTIKLLMFTIHLILSPPQSARIEILWNYTIFL